MTLPNGALALLIEEGFFVQIERCSDDVDPTQPMAEQCRELFRLAGSGGRATGPIHTRLEVNFVMQAFLRSPLELRTVHANQAVHLDEFHNIIRGAVEIKRRFICEALSCEIICMNSDMTAKHIEFVADRQLAVWPLLIFAELFHTACIVLVCLWGVHVARVLYADTRS